MRRRSAQRKGAREQSRASVVYSDAIISGRYRYRLTRELATGRGTLLVIMVNPSKADAKRNDHTIAKLIEFTRLLGYRKLLVGNLFAYRATDIRDLSKAKYPQGRDNYMYLAYMMQEADRVIVAWGSSKKLPLRARDQWRDVEYLAQSLPAKLYCWGTTNDGHPKHPLRLAYSTKLQLWKPQRSRV